MTEASLVLRRLDAAAPGFDRELAALTAFEAAQDPAVDATVAQIVADVRARGDAALLEYTAKFDGVEATSMAALEISAADMRRAFDTIPEAQRAALRTAAARIRAYHERHKLESWSYREPDGSTFGQQVTPLDRVGVYVPGGKAAYPSSVLMNVIPAHVAGVAGDRHGRSHARRRAQSARARRGASRRRVARVRDRRRPGGRGAGLRHGDGPGGGQDLRPRQRLRRGGEAPGVRRGRHRHGRRACPRSS